MLKTDKIIVVEGKYDKIKLSSLIDGVIIATEGFGIFKDKEKQRFLRKLAEKKDIVILTDSDSAGFLIRNFLSGILPKSKIINAYIPDIYGKEKRKAAPSKEGKLGVEGVSAEKIKSALEKAGVFVSEADGERRQVTKQDFYSDGFTGGAGSKEKRLKLLKKLDLPQNMTANSMIEIINAFMSFDDYKKALGELEKE